MNSFKKQFPYSSQRMPMMAKNMVASSQSLAVQAGVDALRRGGNAVDAALTTAITLNVVEPTMNGIGGDAFCILWDGKQLHGLNASGRSPAATDKSDFADLSEMPFRGWDAITVPGQVSGWVALSEKFGKLPFEKLFEAAIGYAREGFMVTPVSARLWQQAEGEFADFDDFSVFLPDGKAPRSADHFSFPDQARTLEIIAQSKGEAFYRGELAQKIINTAERDGAKMTMQDLHNHQVEWVTPISQGYNGYELHEIPPNGQGLAALITLGILQHRNVAQYEIDSADSIHCQIEAMKLGFADARRYVADPAFMDTTSDQLLNDDYLATRAALIDMNQARNPGYGVPSKSGTVYLSTADQSGMMVSYIQSNYAGFGSGIVIPDTGISLQNRGAGFVLDEGHPNQIGGGKKPFHTIIPAFLTKDGQPVMSFGVMGGHMQAQGHTQMVIRVCDYGQNPQAANDAPRWQVMDENMVMLEDSYDPAIRAALARRGHKLVQNDEESRFELGGAQLILKTDHGYIGSSDPRKDGMAAGF